MRSWIIKQLRKVKNVVKKDLEFKIEVGDKGLVDAVKKYFEILLEQLEAAQKENINDNSQSDDISNKDIEKVIRVKPKRARKNSMGEEIFDVDEEETTPSTNCKY